MKIEFEGSITDIEKECFAFLKQTGFFINQKKREEVIEILNKLNFLIDYISNDRLGHENIIDDYLNLLNNFKKELENKNEN